MLGVNARWNGIGYRAPDAPGLASAAAHLFILFAPVARITFVFGGDEDARLAVASMLSHWPHGAVRSVRVLVGQSAQGVSGEVLEDNEGHAYAAYASGVPEGEMTVMVFVRSGSSSASYEEEQPFSPLSVLLDCVAGYESAAAGTAPLGLKTNLRATDLSIGLIKSGRDKRSQGRNGADAPHNSRKLFSF
ncbi:hypothetical protein DFH07DRAFT_957446 [Mycena maculata]|uniref:Uncharacterized protein n=1 Tax=Mycena maculata TaxID=230809 RepID=A0AAD7NHU9_9AGAR|nr:hypothetical protein DFH07DRAFT_957446 [Mycena maculata]